MRDEARADAERMRLEARGDADRLVAEARQRAEEIVAETGAQHRALDEELAAVKAEREAAADVLRQLADQILARSSTPAGPRGEGDDETRPLSRWRESASAAARAAEE
jgi:vacuolar-type H+-ATPase subunit H